MTGEWTAELEHWIRERTVEAGFDAAGIAPVSAPESDASQLDAERFSAWVAAGRAGEMEYLKRCDDHGVLLRSGVQVAMPWARSVVVVCAELQRSGSAFYRSRTERRRMDRQVCLERSRCRCGFGRADPHGLSRRVAAPSMPGRERFEAEAPLRDQVLRRHGSSGRTCCCGKGQYRLDWEKHLCHQSGSGIVAAAGRHRDVASGGRNRCAQRSGGPLRQLHPLYRCVSYRRSGRPAGDGCFALHCLPDHRKKGNRPA